MIAITIISVACVALALFIFFRYGREYRPKFTEKYWRDVPARDVHPAVVTRIWNWNEPAKDISVTLLHLSEMGVIRLIALPEQVVGNKKRKDYAIVKVKDFKGTLTKIDWRLMDFLFGTFSQDVWKEAGKQSARYEILKHIEGKHKLGDVVFLSDFEQYASRSSEKFSYDVKGVRKEIDNQVKKLKVFEDDGPSFAMLLGLMAVGLFAAFALVNIMFPDMRVWALELIVAMIFCIVLAVFMKRRSPYANEIAAKSAALKRWLEDFSRLDERPITDTKVWGKLMVFAAAFGVAGKALEQLRHVAPNVPNDSVFMDAVGVWFEAVLEVGAKGVVEGASDIVGDTAGEVLAGTDDLGFDGDIGGFVEGISGAAGDVIGGVGDVAGDILGGVVDVVGGIIEGFADAL